jgi:hypothetical protein
MTTDIEDLYIDVEDPEDVIPCECPCCLENWFDFDDGWGCFECNALTCEECHDMEERKCKNCMEEDV